MTNGRHKCFELSTGKTLILWRGITVRREEAEHVIEKIKCDGLKGDEGFWRFTGWELRPSIEDLINKPDLSTKDTREGYREFPVIAFADELGAYYYAFIHNYKEGSVPIIIKIKVDISRKYIYVDGRDFLYPVFGLWDKKNLAKKYGVSQAFNKVLSVLKNIYGDKIEVYFRKVVEVNDPNYRIAMCDLAVHDLDVVLGHYRNKIVIRGRYHVTFRSAFFVEAPIQPSEIIDIFIPRENKFEFTPDVVLYEWL